METPECAARAVGRSHKPGVTFEGDEPAASPALTPPSAAATSAGSPSWLTTVSFACSLFHAERAVLTHLFGTSPSGARAAGVQPRVLPERGAVLPGAAARQPGHTRRRVPAARQPQVDAAVRCRPCPRGLSAAAANACPIGAADTGVRCGAPATSCLLLADLAVNFARSIVSSAGPLVRERCAHLACAPDAHAHAFHTADGAVRVLLLAGSSHMHYSMACTCIAICAWRTAAMECRTAPAPFPANHGAPGLSPEAVPPAARWRTRWPWPP